ncbi:hypothetical protein ACTD5D_22040 [Nocardia takedensis]|uniref:hypothetical protein n=1 Tax=Nocardia takedensis TaxID=259390 RepID=UPI003F7779C1
MTVSVEVVVVCDELSAQPHVSVYLDGVPVAATSYVIDAGAGWEWEDWREFRDEALSTPSSPACRAELLDVFDDPPGGESMLGRDHTPWLDGVDPEDRFPSRYRLTGARTVVVGVPAGADIHAVARGYLREHLREGHRLLDHHRCPAADAVAPGTTTRWETVLTAAIADPTGKVSAHQLLYRHAPEPDGDLGRLRVELAHRHEIEGSPFYRGLDAGLLACLTPAGRGRARRWRRLVQQHATPPDTGKDT